MGLTPSSGPVVASTRGELCEALPGLRSGGLTVALVPTMGALHEGHTDLMRRARQEADVVVVSIFVNPLQFGPAEDFTRYPRDLRRDVETCAGAGVDIVFAPILTEMYPAGTPVVTIDPGPLGRRLEGAVRPGHFTGVLTVVAKLVNLTRPGIAVFGEKDYQQLVLIRRLAADLSFAVDVVGVETRRDPDGLALSSRNGFLEPAQRAAAVSLSRALAAAAAAGSEGRSAVLAAAWRVLQQQPAVSVDYLELCTPDLSQAAAGGEARLLVAAQVGTTRLIDNTAIHLP